MTSHHPELAARARWLPHGVARWWTIPLLKRATTWQMARAGSPAREVPLDGCSVFVHRPDRGASAPRPALLWIHGGGLLFGDARQDDAFLRTLVTELDLVVASAQHRFAPEHPFPTPLDDCEQALRWLIAQPDVDPDRVIVGGASAGGHLAAALCQRVHARGDVQVGFQLLVYPMLDDRSGEGTGPHDRLFRLWDRPSNRMGWSSYLRGHDRNDPPPFAVPGRTQDLTGLPPAWIGVGDLDLFLDEDVSYAERLRAAGVPVELEVVPGAYHGFDAFDGDAPVSRRFRQAQIDAMARYLGGHRGTDAG